MPEVGGWPLIGRAEELDVIAGATGKSGTSAGVVIFGKLGVGKSRLAHEAAQRCGGALVRWASGSSAARAIPLGAFVNWLPADVFEPVHAAARVVNELIKGAGSRPCIIVVDDAHLLDDTSAFMLAQLVDRRLARLVLTAAAARRFRTPSRRCGATGCFSVSTCSRSARPTVRLFSNRRSTARWIRSASAGCGA